jgi:hypothetical protein
VTDNPARHPPAEGAGASLKPGGRAPSAAFAPVRAHRGSRQANSGKLGGWTRLERRGEPWRLAGWQCESRPCLR